MLTVEELLDLLKQEESTSDFSISGFHSVVHRAAHIGPFDVEERIYIEKNGGRRSRIVVELNLPDIGRRLGLWDDSPLGTPRDANEIPLLMKAIGGMARFDVGPYIRMVNRVQEVQASWELVRPLGALVRVFSDEEDFVDP